MAQYILQAMTSSHSNFHQKNFWHQPSLCE